jgi:hypothetical protein
MEGSCDHGKEYLGSINMAKFGQILWNNPNNGKWT